MMDAVKIGALICELRNDRGMTQKQLAKCLNISDKTVSKWERVRDSQICPCFLI